MDLKGAEIFAEGTHNGIPFDTGDLDRIVSGFDFFNLSGKVPLKLGHNAEQPLTDGQPALGWVDRIWRAGKTLFADFKDVPQVLYEAIRAGRYKNVSIELLRDVQAGTRVVPYVLDAVALLGADIPAVGSLKDLQSLTMADRQGRERLCFARSFTEFGGNDPMDNDALRAQLAEQTQTIVAMTLEAAVRDGRMMAAGREQFTKRYGATGTVADAHAWIASAPKPQRFSRAASSSGNADTSGLPDAVLVARTRQYIAENALRHLQLTGERLTFDRAAMIVVREIARTDPALLRAYVDMPGEV